MVKKYQCPYGPVMNNLSMCGVEGGGGCRFREEYEVWKQRKKRLTKQEREELEQERIANKSW